MNRVLVEAIILSCIISLCLYSHVEYGKRHSSIPDVDKDPGRYENVSFRSEGTVMNISAGPTTNFTFVTMGDRIDAVYSGGERLEEGDYAIVYGVLHPLSGYLEVTKMHVYADIRRLYALSLLGLGLLLWLFLRNWRFSFSELIWRDRDA